jgi:predicted ATPase
MAITAHEGALAELGRAGTDSVPLFIEELTKSVLEGRLAARGGGSLRARLALPPFAILTTLHASLMAWLDRLASVRRVAQIGAAIGVSFPTR